MASHSPLAFIFLNEQRSVWNGCCYKANETSIMTIQSIKCVRKIPAYFVYVHITNSFSGWFWLVKFPFQHFSLPCRFPINIFGTFIYKRFCKKKIYSISVHILCGKRKVANAFALKIEIAGFSETSLNVIRLRVITLQ